MARGGPDIVSPIIEDQRENDDTMMSDQKQIHIEPSLRERVLKRKTRPGNKPPKKSHLIWEIERKARKKAAK